MAREYRHIGTLSPLPQPGKLGQLILVGVHYDIVPRVSGADDNASAVAMMLEMAHPKQTEPAERMLSCVLQLRRRWVTPFMVEVTKLLLATTLKASQLNFYGRTTRKGMPKGAFVHRGGHSLEESLGFKSSLGKMENEN